MRPEPSRGSGSLRVLGVIPARLASQRLPRKMLREIAGKPLLAWTYRAALACPQLDAVLIATDSEEIAELCLQNGWPFRMTSPALPSGTDRLHAEPVAAELSVNVQGEEPLSTATHLGALRAPFGNPAVDVSTLRVLCTPEEVLDPNAVKVVTGADGRALYFSRAPIPFDRDNTGTVRRWKHLGLYAYRRDALRRFASLPPGSLEQTERLEQLRLLENGFALHVAEVAQGTVGVDTEEDLRRGEAILRERGMPL